MIIDGWESVRYTLCSHEHTRCLSEHTGKHFLSLDANYSLPQSLLLLEHPSWCTLPPCTTLTADTAEHDNPKVHTIHSHFSFDNKRRICALWLDLMPIFLLIQFRVVIVSCRIARDSLCLQLHELRSLLFDRQLRQTCTTWQEDTLLVTLRWFTALSCCFLCFFQGLR